MMLFMPGGAGAESFDKVFLKCSSVTAGAQWLPVNYPTSSGRLHYLYNDNTLESIALVDKDGNIIWQKYEYRDNGGASTVNDPVIATYLDNIYMFGQETVGGTGYNFLMKINVSDGSIAWTKRMRLAGPKIIKVGNDGDAYIRADADGIFVSGEVSGENRIAAMHFATDGTHQWSVLVDTHTNTVDSFRGMAISPNYAYTLYAVNGSEGYFLNCFNRSTGALVWDKCPDSNGDFFGMDWYGSELYLFTKGTEGANAAPHVMVVNDSTGALVRQAYWPAAGAEMSRGMGIAVNSFGVCFAYEVQDVPSTIDWSMDVVVSDHALTTIIWDKGFTRTPTFYLYNLITPGNVHSIPNGFLVGHWHNDISATDSGAMLTIAGNNGKNIVADVQSYFRAEGATGSLTPGSTSTIDANAKGIAANTPTVSSETGTNSGDASLTMSTSWS